MMGSYHTQTSSSLATRWQVVRTQRLLVAKLVTPVVLVKPAASPVASPAAKTLMV